MDEFLPLESLMSVVLIVQDDRVSLCIVPFFSGQTQLNCLVDPWCKPFLEVLPGTFVPLNGKSPKDNPPVIRRRDPRNGKAAPLRVVNILVALRDCESDDERFALVKDFPRLIDKARMIRTTRALNGCPLDCRLNNWRVISRDVNIPTMEELEEVNRVEKASPEARIIQDQPISNQPITSEAVEVDCIKFRKELERPKTLEEANQEVYDVMKLFPGFVPPEVKKPSVTPTDVNTGFGVLPPDDSRAKESEVIQIKPMTPDRFQ